MLNILCYILRYVLGKQGIQLLSKIKKHSVERENMHYIRRHKTFNTISFKR